MYSYENNFLLYFSYFIRISDIFFYYNEHDKHDIFYVQILYKLEDSHQFSNKFEKEEKRKIIYYQHFIFKYEKHEIIYVIIKIY